MRQMWQRHGAPSFIIKAEFDPSITMTQTDLEAAESDLDSHWHDSQEARYRNEGIMDFTYAGQAKVSADAIGADVKELDFQSLNRALQEQCVASVELAPFMLGIQWSTTERLSQEQADAIIGSAEDIRGEVESDFLMVMDWVQRARGLRGNVSIKWKDINLQDAVRQAQADLTAARAQAAETENALTGWLNGWWEQQDAKELAGYEGPVATPLDTPTMPTRGGGGNGAPASEGLVRQLADAQYVKYP